MKLYRLFIEALESLSANKLRSMLTVLGIVIGVAAVIAMLSIGRGAEASITSRIESIGTNLVYVSPGSTNESGVRSAAGSASTLTLDDADALAQLPDVDGGCFGDEQLRPGGLPGAEYQHAPDGSHPRIRNGQLAHPGRW